MEIRDKFYIEDQGTLENYIDIHIDYLTNGKTKISQPHLIDQIA